MSTYTTWRKELTDAMKFRGESWGDVVGMTIQEEKSIDTEFDPGYGGIEGCDFTVWTKGYVYFPACYDGSEWVAVVPRNPCDRAQYHIGG